MKRSAACGVPPGRAGGLLRIPRLKRRGANRDRRFRGPRSNQEVTWSLPGASRAHHWRTVIVPCNHAGRIARDKAARGDVLGQYCSRRDRDTVAYRDATTDCCHWSYPHSVTERGDCPFALRNSKADGDVLVQGQIAACHDRADDDSGAMHD